MYYVYEWFIVATDEVIYVGKGTGRRYRVRKHNRFFDDMLKRYECDSRIVKEFESEEDAFAFEFERVNELRNIGQCVCNIYNGGFGGTRECWTDEMRERYSERNVMKSRRQRARMSKDNPMKDKAVAERVNASKRVPVIIGNRRFESIKAACDEYGVTSSTINGWCINGKTSAGEPCRYEGERFESYKAKRNGSHGRPLTYKGQTYASTGEAAVAIGVAQTTISRWCRKGRDPEGNACKYDDDVREIAETAIKQNAIPIIVNGEWYPSKEHASRALGISSYILTQYLNGKKRDTKYRCEYGNQQPSRGNADNSTTEGSETNR